MATIKRLLRMDQTVTPKKRQQVSEATWTDSAKELIKQFLDEELLKVVHIRTPMGFNVAKEKIFNYESIKAADEVSPGIKNNLMFLTIFVRRTKTRGPVYGLEQRLPGKIKDTSTVFRKPNFTYKWYKNRDGVIIRKNLNTFKSQKIIKHAKTVVKEAQIFYFSYMQDKPETIKQEELNFT